MFKKSITEPKEHNPNDFIYLVHALFNLKDYEISSKEMKDKVNLIRDPNQFYRASMIAHLNAEAAKKRINWHGGEVYQMGTFGKVGLIVDPAYDSLVQIAWNCDLESPCDQKELEKFVQKHKGKIRCPLILLTNTDGLDDIKYNELILKGDENTSVKGVFFKPQDSKTENKGKQLREIVSELMQNEVPLIELPLPLPIKNYDNIKNLEKREMTKRLDDLIAQSKIHQLHLEFYRPELFIHSDLMIEPYSNGFR